jgi:hypothetical protein
VSDDILSSRRALRVPARCEVRAEAAFGAWSAETQDVGPHGCRLVGPHPLRSGQPVRLQITSPRLRRVLQATGRVAWSRAGRPWTYGVAFDEVIRSASHPWFDQLVEEDPELLLCDATPDRLGGSTSVYLGALPAAGAPALSSEEVEVLRRVGDGATLGALQARLSASWPRSRRAVLALLSRHALTVDRTEATDPECWAARLQATARTGGPGLASPGPAPTSPTPAPAAASSLSAEAREAFEVGSRALAEGRFGSARAMLSHAALLAPGNREIRAALDKAMWGISG